MLPDDISDFVDFLLEAEKQAKDDPSEDKYALQLLTDKHFLGILSDIFIGEYFPYCLCALSSGRLPEL